MFAVPRTYIYCILYIIKKTIIQPCACAMQHDHYKITQQKYETPSNPLLKAI